MSGPAPLRVCIDARLRDGVAGGTQQFVMGLAGGLSALEGTEEYLFLAYRNSLEWLRPLLSGPCRMVLARGSAGPAGWKRTLNAVLPVARHAWHMLSPSLGERTIRPPVSDGAAEASGALVMHFATQNAFLTALPSIYQPWDLQHLYLPEFFTPRQRLQRDVLYRRFCAEAEVVAVASAAVGDDLVERYGVPREKLAWVPAAPAVSVYAEPAAAEVEAARVRLSLPEAFAFYPAQTWPHKNHLALLEALAILRDRHGLRVPLVCSGHTNEFFPTLQRRAAELGLAEQVRFVGFVSTAEIQALYRLCRCLVFPTLFEGWGMPLTEAMHAGVPVAASRVPPLPEQAGEAALFFDPRDPGAIAGTLRRLWTDEGLRTMLARRGREASVRFTWDRTARTFRALYRRLGGSPLSEEDQRLLATSAEHGRARTRGPRDDGRTRDRMQRAARGERGT